MYFLVVPKLRKGQSKLDNPETLATLGIQDEDKQNKDTIQYVLDTTIRKQSQITQIKHEPSYKQMEAKTSQHLCKWKS